MGKSKRQRELEKELYQMRRDDVIASAEAYANDIRSRKNHVNQHLEPCDGDFSQLDMQEAACVLMNMAEIEASKNELREMIGVMAAMGDLDVARRLLIMALGPPESESESREIDKMLQDLHDAEV